MPISLFNSAGTLLHVVCICGVHVCGSTRGQHQVAHHRLEAEGGDASRGHGVPHHALVAVRVDEASVAWKLDTQLSQCTCHYRVFFFFFFLFKTLFISTASSFPSQHAINHCIINYLCVRVYVCVFTTEYYACFIHYCTQVACTAVISTLQCASGHKTPPLKDGSKVKQSTDNVLPKIRRNSGGVVADKQNIMDTYVKNKVS